MDPVSWISLLLGIVCSASMALFLRFFKASKNNRFAMILGNYLTCSLIGLLLVKDKGVIMSAEASTYFLGICGGILFVVSLVCMQSSIEKSGAILTSAFSKLGLLVPLALSILFFHEAPGIMQGAGLFIVIIAVWIFSHSRTQKTENFDLLFLLVVLFTNGASDAMAKVYSVLGVSSEQSVYFFILFLSASFLTFLLLLNEKQRTGKKAARRDLAAGIAVGIPNYFSSVLLLRSLASIPAFIVYPVFSTGAILLVTLISIPLFHERLSRRQVTGLGLILFALVLLNV